MKAEIKGPWSGAETDRFLRDSTIPLRLACVGADGFPRVVSVWYLYRDEYFHCVTQRTSQLVAILQKSGRVGFEVAPNEPPYHGVRGQGIADLGHDRDGAILTRLLHRYLGGTESRLGQWLLSRADDEVLITIRPQRLFTWDYRERMQ